MNTCSFNIHFNQIIAYFKVFVEWPIKYYMQTHACELLVPIWTMLIISVNSATKDRVFSE